MSPRDAGDVVERLALALRSVDADVNRTMVASLIAIIVREQAWRSRRVRSGEVVECRTFVDLLCSPPPRGLGATVTRVRALLAEDEWALKMFEVATRAPSSRRAVARRA